MERFNSIKFDERSWNITYDESKKCYFICNHAKLEQFSRFCILPYSDIVGIEHVGHSTFLVYSKFKDFYTIRRIHILKDGYELQYENYCNKIISLDKKRILIQNPEYPVIYNVKTGTEIALPFFQDTSFSLLEKYGKNYLYCSKSIFSNTKKFKSIDNLQFVLDIETFEPALPAFSTLRNAFVDIYTFSDISTLIKTEKQYKEIVDSQLEFINQKINNSSKKILLSSFTKKDW